MTTKEKMLNNFKNLEIITFIAYILGLSLSVVRVRFFGLTILTFTFSELVDEGYLDAVMIIPLYLAIVATFVAILTVSKNEQYFRISAFLSAALPVITLISLQGAITKLDNDIDLTEDFGLVSGGNDIGVYLIIVGIILSLYAAIKFDPNNFVEKAQTPVRRNIMLAPRNDLPEPTYRPQGVDPIEDSPTKALNVSQKKVYNSTFCANCGNAAIDGNLFCSSCGEKVDD